jgi:predicted nuclease of restriction endonuclease-like (RecB) superfamily
MSSLIPTDDTTSLASIRRLVHEARYIAPRRVNIELLRIYWQIGATIIERQKTAPWGSKVPSQLSVNLRAEFLTANGFSPANLKYMRRFAEAWPDQDAIGQRPVGQLPWGHVIELIEKLNDAELRNWSSAKDVAQGWSRPVLAHQIKTHLHLREGAAPYNFPHALERADSELAQQITKDPFTLEFLVTDGDAARRQLEDRLVERINATLRELGPGFAFVGRQVHFDVDGDDFFVDLLFFHVDQLRYVVIELKTTKFAPRDGSGKPTAGSDLSKEEHRYSLYCCPLSASQLKTTRPFAQSHGARVVVLLGNATTVALTAVAFRYQMGRFHALLPPPALASVDQPGNAAS